VLGRFESLGIDHRFLKSDQPKWRALASWREQRGSRDENREKANGVRQHAVSSEQP